MVRSELSRNSEVKAALKMETHQQVCLMDVEGGFGFTNKQGDCGDFGPSKRSLSSLSHW